MPSLRAAAEEGDLSRVNELLREGADPNDPEDEDEYGEAALSVAAGLDYAEIVEVLYNAGADMHHTDVDGTTALHAAAMNNNPNAAQKLLDLGADIHAETDDGETPLHSAAKVSGSWTWPRSDGPSKCIPLLLEARADVFHTNDERQTPLDVALTAKLYKGESYDDFDSGASMLRRHIAVVQNDTPVGPSLDAPLELEV